MVSKEMGEKEEHVNKTFAAIQMEGARIFVESRLNGTSLGACDEHQTSYSESVCRSE